MRKLALLALTLFGLFTFLLTLGGSGTSAAKSDKPSSSETSAAFQKRMATWLYDEHTDRLTDAKTKSACLLSTNQAEFSFPYNGGSTAELCFYKRGKHLNGNLIIDKGQFLCETEGCSISVRYGDGPVQRVSVGEPADDRSDVLVFSNPAPLLQKVGSVERLRIAARFYQAGQQTFDFTPKGLDLRKLN